MIRLVQHHLLHAQQRMKHQVDKRRSERVFNFGDRVYLKLQLQPYVQTSVVAPRANHKLAYKYFGPFEIVREVGAVAYKLRLSASASIHPVFHDVSQLNSSVRPSY